MALKPWLLLKNEWRFLMKGNKNKKNPSYAKWGYIFSIVLYRVFLFTFVPQVLTIYDSFLIIPMLWVLWRPKCLSRGLRITNALFPKSPRRYRNIAMFGQHHNHLVNRRNSPNVFRFTDSVNFTSSRLRLKEQDF